MMQNFMLRCFTHGAPYARHKRWQNGGPGSGNDSHAVRKQALDSNRDSCAYTLISGNYLNNNII